VDDHIDDAARIAPRRSRLKALLPGWWRGLVGATRWARP